MPEIEKVAVIGAGTMGHGIAQVAAMAGYETRLYDADADVARGALPKIEKNLAGGVSRGKISETDASAALGRVTVREELEDAVKDADMIVEAVIEDLDLKCRLFGDISNIAAAEAILATNTSSLPVSSIAEASVGPERVIGMHFFNPVHIMKLVEVVIHDHTASGIIARTREVAEAMGKVPIVVKDTPGFASSRLGVVLGLEAMRMLEQDVASAEDIDKAMELGYGHPMGPLRLSDLVGLDVRLAIAEHLHRELEDERYAPPQILRDKVAAGELGKKTGKGFYEWETTTTS